MKKLTDAYPALTTGAKIPNHWGLEKWKKTMLTAANARKPVNAFSRSGLRISTGLIDGFSLSGDAGGCSGADCERVARGLIEGYLKGSSGQWSGRFAAFN